MLTFAQLCYLAQIGVPIPADEGTVLPLFDHFLTCVGNNEDATLQKSFFYNHVEQLMALLKSYETNQGKRILALVDNAGKATSSLNAIALT